MHLRLKKIKKGGKRCDGFRKSRMITENKKGEKLLEFSFSYVHQTFVPEGERQFASRVFLLCEERGEESLSLVAMTTQNTR